MKIITRDETWIYQCDPESKKQSKQWLPCGSSGPIKFKSQKLAQKVIATVFWDLEGLILIDYLKNQRTITGVCYAEVLIKLKDALIKKRKGKVHGRVLFHMTMHQRILRGLRKMSFENFDGKCSLTHPI